MRFAKPKQKLISGRPQKQSGSGSDLSASYSQPRDVKVHGNRNILPVAARIPCEDLQNTWVNNKGQVRSRTVMGERVYLRQQQAGPPPEQQVLVLSDQILTRFPTPDKYIKCLSMVGYDLKAYTSDLELELIDVNFPYIIIFLGTMQLGEFDAIKQKELIRNLVSAIRVFNENAHVVFSSLVPRPVDYPHSCKVSENFNVAL